MKSVNSRKQNTKRGIKCLPVYIPLTHKRRSIENRIQPESISKYRKKGCKPSFLFKQLTPLMHFVQDVEDFLQHHFSLASFFICLIIKLLPLSFVSNEESLIFFLINGLNFRAAVSHTFFNLKKEKQKRGDNGCLMNPSYDGQFSQKINWWILENIFTRTIFMIRGWY